LQASAVQLLMQQDKLESDMSEEKVRTEEFRVNGEELLTKIKNLLKEGNIRRISIKDKEGKVVFEIPLTFGVVGALLAPQLVAIGAIAALLTEATVVVEKTES
jgi:hypothetical protein